MRNKGKWVDSKGIKKKISLFKECISF